MLQHSTNNSTEQGGAQNAPAVKSGDFSKYSKYDYYDGWEQKRVEMEKQYGKAFSSTPKSVFENRSQKNLDDFNAEMLEILLFYPPAKRIAELERLRDRWLSGGHGAYVFSRGSEKQKREAHELAETLINLPTEERRRWSGE